MNNINISKCLNKVVCILAMFVLSGCSLANNEIVTDVVPTASLQESPTVALPTITITSSPEKAYPAPIVETVEAPTQEIQAYPAPISATQPVISPTSIPTIANSGINPVNPYPLQEPPVQQQVGSISSPAYPPPGEATSIVGSPGFDTKPTEIAHETPSPQVTAIPLGTPFLTPLANPVRTKFVASDPTMVDLEAGRPQLVVFFADWCTLCKSIAPVVMSLDGVYRDRMNFIYLDVDDRRTNTFQTKLNYSLIARPRMYLIDGTGVVLRDWMGYVTLDELQQAIDAVVPATPVPASP
jgi:thiol-disulfide isomerase/thioredoxin